MLYRHSPKVVSQQSADISSPAVIPESRPEKVNSAHRPDNTFVLATYTIVSCESYPACVTITPLVLLARAGPLVHREYKMSYFPREGWKRVKQSTDKTPVSLVDFVERMLVTRTRIVNLSVPISRSRGCGNEASSLLYSLQ